jgi:hypothetical protein
MAAMAFVATRWRVIWRLAILIVETGRRFWGNLTTDERSELTGLVRKGFRGPSGRTPWSNLSAKELSRLRALVTKAATGRAR